MVRRGIAVTLFLAALAVLAFAAQTATVQAAPPKQNGVVGNPGKGAYLFALAGGCGCHMGAAGFLAGGEVFELGPAGKVYAKNITSDVETGIGSWTEQDVVNALRHGKRPDGEQLFPVMPYPYFSGMSEQDLHDVAAFIKTAPPVSNKVPARELNVPVPPFTAPPQPADAPTEGVARGSYIVNTIAHCSDCHTPTTAEGAPDMSRFLAGNPMFGSANITPSEEFGIGKWSQEQIYLLLKTGKRPDGSSVGGLMQLVLDGGLHDITEKDGFAVAAYLKTVPPVNAAPGAAAPPAAPPPQTLPTTGNSTPSMLIPLIAVVLMLLAGGAFVWRRARKV